MPEQITHSLPDTLGQCKPGTRVLIETLESKDCYIRGYRVDAGIVYGESEDGRMVVHMDHGATWYLQKSRALDVDRYVLT